MERIPVYTAIYWNQGRRQLKPAVIYDEQENYLVDSTPVINPENSFDNEISHFIECIREGKEPIAPPEDGLEVQKMLNGIYDSAKLGKEVIL